MHLLNQDTNFNGTFLPGNSGWMDFTVYYTRIKPQKKTWRSRTGWMGNHCSVITHNPNVEFILLQFKPEIISACACFSSIQTWLNSRKKISTADRLTNVDIIFYSKSIQWGMGNGNRVWRSEKSPELTLTSTNCVFH